MANTEIIPVIDLSPYLAGAAGAIDRTAEELHFALTEIGFYFIVNHGVPSEQIDSVFRQAARFHALPLEKKLEVRLDKHNVGYLPMKGDTLRTSTVEIVTKANMNEAFFVAREMPSDHPEVLADRRFRSANRWPAGMPGFREPIVAYCGDQPIDRPPFRPCPPATAFDFPSRLARGLHRPLARHGDD
jgi:isopenicillin N synthase-like dioxygenase